MTVNSGTTAITVPDAFKDLRFWRNTRVANLAAGDTASLAPGSLGYEWDEDLDNGSRPAGLMHLSSTTFDGAEKLINFGAQTAVGSATHSLTLYRAGNALVFGAGTVQWAWGLDASHDDHTQSPPSHATGNFRLPVRQIIGNLERDRHELYATELANGGGKAGRPTSGLAAEDGL